MLSDDEKVEMFRRFRPRLFGIAYRMLGTHAEAEDILQEAYLKWHQAEKIETPEAWLVTIVSRLSIDRLRRASKERETYTGPWLPEPLALNAAFAPSPAERLETASDLSIAFLILLERLSPTERAAFLLHDVFDCGYAEIARALGKTETASRQIVTRARTRIKADKPRFAPDETARKKLIKKFAAASVAGDQDNLIALFADDIVSISDGGGKVTAARKIIRDKVKLAHALAMFGRKYGTHFRQIFYPFNGEIGILTFIDGKIYAATSFEFDETGQITGLYRIMNPDKLRAFENIQTENLEFLHEQP